MAWIESHQSLRLHPKTRKLARELGVSLPQAIGHLHCLWWWALDYAQDGDLSQYEADEIADGAEWDGDPAVFIESLRRCGFVTDKAIHDWQDYAGRLIERREKNRERMRQARGADTAVTCNARATHVQDTCNARATRVQDTCEATIPNLTQPNLKTLKPSLPKSSRLSAPGDTDWKERAAQILAGAERFRPEFERLAELLAEDNKTGTVSIRRVVRELYEPLARLAAETNPDAFRYGLEAAITAGAPNARYVAKAAGRYRTNGNGNAPGATSRGPDLSDYDDNFLTEG
jgi:hypothetical protein